MDSKESKEWTTYPVTADLLLSKVPTFVKHICLTADATNPVTVLIYDGVDTGGKLKLALFAIAATQASDEFGIPIYFEHGIYIDISANNTLFTIQFKEERG